MRRLVALVAVALVAVALVVVSLGAASPAHAARRQSPIELRPVLAPLPSLSVTTTAAPVDLAAARATVAACDVAALQQLAAVPSTRKRAAEPDECVVFPEWPGGVNAPRYYLGPARGLRVRNAKAQFVTGQGWTVKLDLTKSGANAWDDLAREQFHEQVAFVVDGQVVAAPTIQPNDTNFTSFGGTAVISGAFGKKDAAAIARRAMGK